MDQHLTGFSLVGAVVLVAVSIGGGILAVTSSSFSNTQPQPPTATSSLYATSSNHPNSTSSTSNKESQPEKQSQTITVDGAIQRMDASEMSVDGPMRITIQTDNGQKQITVPSGESSVCQTEGQIADLFSLSEGDRISVRGKIDSGGSIVPCESSSHYLRKKTQQANAATSTTFLRFSKSNAIGEPIKGNTLRTWYEITFSGNYKLYEEIYLSGSGNQMETNGELVATGTVSQSRLQELKNTLSSARFYNFPSSVPQSDGRLQFEGPSGSITIKVRSKPGEIFHAVRHNEGARGGTYPTGYLQIKDKLSNRLESFQSSDNSDDNGSEQAIDEDWRGKLDVRLTRLVEDNMNSQLEPERVNNSGEGVYGVFIETDQPQKLKDIGIDVNSVSGEIVTARITENEIIKVAKLKSVSWIDSGGRLEPTTDGGGQLNPL